MHRRAVLLFWFLFFLAYLLALVSRKIVMPPAVKILPICFLCSATTNQLAIFVSPATGSSLLWEWRFVIYVPSLGVDVVLLARAIGRRVEDPTFWWKLSLLYLEQMLMAMVVRFAVLPNAPSWSDVEKVAYVLIVHPSSTSPP